MDHSVNPDSSISRTEKLADPLNSDQSVWVRFDESDPTSQSNNEVNRIESNKNRSNTDSIRSTSIDQNNQSSFAIEQNNNRENEFATIDLSNAISSVKLNGSSIHDSNTMVQNNLDKSILTQSSSTSTSSSIGLQSTTNHKFGSYLFVSIVHLKLEIIWLIIDFCDS